MRRRLRLSNCFPRWAPTGSQSGCSHAKWLQMRGVIQCWLRLNLPGNLPSCLCKSGWLSAGTDQGVFAAICADCWQFFFCSNISIHTSTHTHPHTHKLQNKLLFGSLNFSLFCQVRAADCWLLAVCWSWCPADDRLISGVTGHRNRTKGGRYRWNSEQQETSAWIQQTWQWLNITAQLCDAASSHLHFLVGGTQRLLTPPPALRSTNNENRTLPSHPLFLRFKKRTNWQTKEAFTDYFNATTPLLNPHFANLNPQHDTHMCPVRWSMLVVAARNKSRPIDRRVSSDSAPLLHNLE